MDNTNNNPKPTVDADEIIPPDRPHHPQETVGSEGGASLVGTPRRLENDDDEVRSYPAGREQGAEPTPSAPSDHDRDGRG